MHAKVRKFGRIKPKVKKSMNAELRRKIAWICEVVGCVVCGAPAQWHHPRQHTGMGMKAPHESGYPLCAFHHAIRHDEYGPEQDFLDAHMDGKTPEEVSQECWDRWKKEHVL